MPPPLPAVGDRVWWTFTDTDGRTGQPDVCSGTGDVVEVDRDSYSHRDEVVVRVRDENGCVDDLFYPETTFRRSV